VLVVNAHRVTIGGTVEDPGLAKVRTVAVLAGVARSLVNFRGSLIRRIAGDGHRVYAMAPQAAGLAEQIEGLGAVFVPVELARTGIDPVADVAASRYLHRQFEALDIDTLLAYTIKPVVLGIPAAARAGVKTRVALVTGLGYSFGTDTLKQRAVGVAAKALYRRAMRHATAVRFQNPDDLAEFVSRRLVDPRLACVVAGSGIDVDAFVEVPPSTGDHVRFLLIARLIAEKGIREFALAARLVRAIRSDCEFHLVGPLDTNPTALSREEIATWEQEGTLVVHPRTEDVRDHLAACDVYVLPSYREGTPRTVLEAMATGRPVITTNAPGCRETTVDGDNGYLVPVKDVHALAAAMLRLADDRGMRVRMGRRSREIAVQKYDVHKVNQAMMEAMELLP